MNSVDPLNLYAELAACRQLFANILEDVKGAENPEDELILREGPICRITTQIQKLVYCIVKVERLRNHQLSKTDVLALAAKIADVADKHIPKSKKEAFLEEVHSLIEAYDRE